MSSNDKSLSGPVGPASKRVATCPRHTKQPRMHVQSEISRGEPRMYWIECFKDGRFSDCDCGGDVTRSTAAAERRMATLEKAWGKRAARSDSEDTQPVAATPTTLMKGQEDEN